MCAEEPLLPQLSDDCPKDLRYVGGARFDCADGQASASSGEWKSFGRGYWMLPRVEVSATFAQSSPASSGSAASSEASSSPGTPVAGGATAVVGEGRLLPRAVLSVNLRWPTDGGQEGWLAERRRAMEALKKVRFHTAAGRRGVAAQRRDTVSRDEFKARVREALDAFSSGQLHKVVLARRMLLDLVWEQDSVELLRQAFPVLLWSTKV
ncbi:hypothetical protein AK812_SmicGene26968 [Symbiodinium microadriaticum]|uniref:Uncharacterized protein n=1 Tax=Symbiodinium microadriaticum TaxID=2951 RepID=A0A1Q9D859_SYMMI|nr:hypothetical protein AK812_SmicGene26968 [Symbiodinium microadriaticum]